MGILGEKPWLLLLTQQALRGEARDRNAFSGYPRLPQSPPGLAHYSWPGDSILGGRGKASYKDRWVGGHCCQCRETVSWPSHLGTTQAFWGPCLPGFQTQAQRDITGQDRGTLDVFRNISESQDERSPLYPEVLLRLPCLARAVTLAIPSQHLSFTTFSHILTFSPSPVPG